jgi:ribosomal protein S18 acetylase RimI-like enzyme
MRTEIVPYKYRFKKYFERLNRNWLEEFFEVEPADEMVFQNPEYYILQPGGQIFFILQDDTPVGTCAVIPVGMNKFELSKMAVDPAYRRLGYGTRLMEAVIEFARKANASTIFLITDTKLTAAIRLYQRYGFTIVPHTPDPRYQRGNMRMELALVSQK